MTPLSHHRRSFLFLMWLNVVLVQLCPILENTEAFYSDFKTPYSISNTLSGLLLLLLIPGE